MAFETNKSLLSKVKSGDEVSWHDFYHAYRPLIWLRGKDIGLTEKECEELVQQVMLEIFRKDILVSCSREEKIEIPVFKYDPGKGRFRHFMKGIITRQALNVLRQRDYRTVPMEKQDFEGDNALERAWDEEWYKHLLNMAMVELRVRVETETYQAFELYALRGRSAEETAAFLDISLSSVYTAKSRCVSMLREIANVLDER